MLVRMLESLEASLADMGAKKQGMFFIFPLTPGYKNREEPTGQKGHLFRVPWLGNSIIC